MHWYVLMEWSSYRLREGADIGRFPAAALGKGKARLLLERRGKRRREN